MTAKIISAEVVAIKSLNSDVVSYQLYPSEAVDFDPGQYLQLIIEDVDYSYSIANAPREDNFLELHIRHSTKNSSNEKVLAKLRHGSRLNIRMPLGECSLQNFSSQNPLLFIAVGLGFVPIKSILEYLFANGCDLPLQLYWGARAENDVYYDDILRIWQEQNSNFRYNPIIYADQKQRLIETVLSDNAAVIADYNIVLCGPFEFIYALRDNLVAAGVPKEHLFSDAFSFES